MATYLVYGKMTPEKSRPHRTRPLPAGGGKKHRNAFDTLATA